MAVLKHSLFLMELWVARVEGDSTYFLYHGGWRVAGVGLVAWEDRRRHKQRISNSTSAGLRSANVDKVVAPAVSSYRRQVAAGGAGEIPYAGPCGPRWNIGVKLLFKL